MFLFFKPHFFSSRLICCSFFSSLWLIAYLVHTCLRIYSSFIFKHLWLTAYLVHICLLICSSFFFKHLWLMAHFVHICHLIPCSLFSSHHIHWQTFKAGQRISLTTYCPWATCLFLQASLKYNVIKPPKEQKKNGKKTFHVKQNVHIMREKEDHCKWRKQKTCVNFK